MKKFDDFLNSILENTGNNENKVQYVKYGNKTYKYTDTNPIFIAKDYSPIFANMPSEKATSMFTRIGNDIYLDKNKVGAWLPHGINYLMEYHPLISLEKLFGNKIDLGVNVKETINKRLNDDFQPTIEFKNLKDKSGGVYYSSYSGTKQPKIVINSGKMNSYYKRVDDKEYVNVKHLLHELSHWFDDMGRDFSTGHDIHGMPSYRPYYLYYNVLSDLNKTKNNYYNLVGEAMARKASSDLIDYRKSNKNEKFEETEPFVINLLKDDKIIKDTIDRAPFPSDKLNMLFYGRAYRDFINNVINENNYKRINAFEKAKKEYKSLSEEEQNKIKLKDLTNKYKKLNGVIDINTFLDNLLSKGNSLEYIHNWLKKVNKITNY